jgi:hypothetical protein
MNTRIHTNTIFLAIGVAAVLAVVIAPTLLESALAKKEEVTVCPSGNECQGASGDRNPNAEDECRAGSKDQTNANCT